MNLIYQEKTEVGATGCWSWKITKKVMRWETKEENLKQKMKTTERSKTSEQFSNPWNQSGGMTAMTKSVASSL